MGFNAPDFNIRVDIIPEITTTIRLQPMKAGKFSFFCDLPCGAGHKDMKGLILVG